MVDNKVAWDIGMEIKDAILTLAENVDRVASYLQEIMFILERKEEKEDKE